MTTENKDRPPGPSPLPAPVKQPRADLWMGRGWCKADKLLEPSAPHDWNAVSAYATGLTMILGESAGHLTTLVAGARILARHVSYADLRRRGVALPPAPPPPARDDGELRYLKGKLVEQGRVIANQGRVIAKQGHVIANMEKKLEALAARDAGRAEPLDEVLPSFAHMLQAVSKLQRNEVIASASTRDLARQVLEARAANPPAIEDEDAWASALVDDIVDAGD